MDDYWRNKEKEDRRSHDFFKAVREKNYDEAMHKADPDHFVDYLNYKQQIDYRVRNEEPMNSELAPEQTELLDLIAEQESLDVEFGNALRQEVFAIDPSEPAAFRKFADLRNYILSLF